jgi:hypothetical protein
MSDPNTLMARLLRDVRQSAMDQSLNGLLTDLHAQADGLQQDVDKLAIQIEKVLRERAHIVEVLTQFYRSDISMSALQGLLDLAVELNPSLKHG